LTRRHLLATPASAFVCANAGSDTPNTMMDASKVVPNVGHEDLIDTYRVNSIDCAESGGELLFAGRELAGRRRILASPLMPVSPGQLFSTAVGRSLCEPSLALSLRRDSCGRLDPTIIRDRTSGSQTFRLDPLELSRFKLHGLRVRSSTRISQIRVDLTRVTLLETVARSNDLMPTCSRDR
jgi:hypothetical protein